ncbi:alpha/beta hydrolase [Kribbella sp. NBC_01484]|uniref:alpha/beta fold hydrolase n=1 Tax=Kribbella sp. NBC_01484 TaxID=2903579 RepID=UPI002E2EF536|nr:alpha/beta hydrolase [Kribbella sp. NBC_01484]
MEFVQLADGRKLEYLIEGPADGIPLVFHHGTPGAAVRFAPLAEAAEWHGLRLVSPGRPGYGASTPQPGRSISDVAADVSSLLDAIGADRFLSIGLSGGGPHSLASAALLADRCIAAATLAGVGPANADGLDFVAGMGEENIAEFGAAFKGRAALEPLIEEQSSELAGAAPQDLAAAFGDLVSEVDKAAMTGPILDWLAASARRSVAESIAGWRDDDLAFVKDWGFRLDRITTPVAIWQGDQDRMVPEAHGHWLAAHVSGATFHFEADEGHLSLLNGIDRVVADLVAHLT